MLKCDDCCKHTSMMMNLTDQETCRILKQDVKSNLNATEAKHVQEEITSNLSTKALLCKIVPCCLNSHGSSNLQHSKDPLEVANSFKRYFVSVGGTASTKGKQLAFNHDLFLYPLTSQEPPFCPLTENDARPRFTFQGISANTVLDIITGMPNNKAPGCDKIGVNIIKGVLPHILHVITEIFNHFLTPGCFPKDWKIAEVASHPKHGDHEEPVTSTSCHCCQSYLRYWNALSTTSWSAV